MGAETSVLQGCKLEDPLPSPSQDWTIHPAQRKDGSRVSVFVHKKPEASESRTEYHLENAARQLKILRHPTILKFFASCENVDGTFLITEQVKPLDLVIDSLTPEEICAGLYNVVEALSFLHERGGASHNNVCMSSIYVSSQDGGWRLGGMEHLCKYEDATVQFLKHSKPMRNAQCIPPEEKDETMTSTAPSYGHARDAYAFGVLATNMLEYLSDLGEMTDSFEIGIEAFLDPDPMRRPKLSTLMSDKLFKNDFLEITNFIKNLTLKSESQKNSFFEGLAQRLHRLPRQLVASRIAPLLLNSFVMAEQMAVCHLFPHLLVPYRDIGSKRHQEFLPDQVNPLIPLELFKRHMIPVLGKVFPSRELHVRIVLLEHFAYYADLFHEEKLKRVILPQLLIGLKDSNDDIVAASLRALADIVPILGATTVVGGERERYFVEGRPKFPKQPERQLLKSDQVSSLTAVSGVITIPMMGKSPMTLPTKGSEVKQIEVMTSEPDLTSGNDELEAVARKEERERQQEERERQRKERERRREEMRLKNEERKRERERKRALQAGTLTLAALAKEHAEETASHSSQSLSPSQPAVPSSPSHDSQATSNISIDEESDSDKPDWSDWEEMDDVTPSIQNRDLSTSNQSEERIGNDSITVNQSRTSSDNKESFDWTAGDADWNDTDADWSVPSSPKTNIVKKKTNALKLKSSAKKKDGDIEQNTKELENENKLNIKLQSSKTSQKLAHQRYKQPPKELGKEYDIPDITTMQNSEPDFFADMEPTLKFSNSGRTSVTSDATSGNTGRMVTSNEASGNTGRSSETSNEASRRTAMGLSDADSNVDSSTLLPETTKDESSKSMVHVDDVSKAEAISFAVDDMTVTGDGDDGWGADDDDFNWDIEDES